jgi:tryptophanyl-tRNA synthetase
MNKPVILTGIRAYTDLHIGNYFGALLPMVDMACERSEQYQINLFVPDLHSLTTPIDYSQLQKGIAQTLRFFVAAGLPLNKPDVHIYRQSYIPAHTELAWILNCFTGFGELTRMAEFKDKSARLGSDHIGVGQFDYPPLMAADILLYDAVYVPVGEDQRQHIEYTRDIAERMNKRFGDLFVIPKSMAEQHEFFGKDQGLRIRDLSDPAKKMSKSAESDKGVIFLIDSPEEARKKIMSAETDSLSKVNYDYDRQPGVSNLLDLVTLLGGNRDEFIGQAQYGPLKTAVADKVAEFLQDFQVKLSAVDDAAVNKKLETSEQLMAQQAGKTLLKVQKAVGLRA